MTGNSGGWVDEIVDSHRCEIFEPPQRHEDGFVLIYLHGVHQASLQDKRPFVDLFARLGLPVVAPCGPIGFARPLISTFPRSSMCDSGWLSSFASAGGPHRLASGCSARAWEHRGL